MSRNRLNGLAMLRIHREIDVETSEVLLLSGKKESRRLDFIIYKVRSRKINITMFIN